MGLKEYFQENKKHALLVLFLMTLTQVMTTIYTYLTSPELDAISKGKFVLFLELIGMQFVFGQICNVSFNLASVENTKQTQNLFHSVRQRILHHYYQQPDKVSEMENHLGNDLQIIQDSYYHIYFYFLCDAIYIVLTIGTLFTFHWVLVAFTLFVTFLAVLVPKLMEKYTNKATELVSSKNAQFLNTIEKWFDGLDELRRYKNKVVLKKVIGQDSQKLEDSEFKRSKTMSYVQLVSSIFDITGRIGVPLIAGILFINHQVSLGAILTAGYFANGIFWSVKNCISNYVQLKSTQTLRNIILELQKTSNEEKYDPIDEVASIEIRKLSIKYKHGQQIFYPDFSINLGEKVLLTGDSGTGKSTLIKTLLGQIKPISGEVIYRNFNGKVIHPDLRQIGYLAQDLIMFPGTIKENITMFDEKLNSSVQTLVDATQFSTDQDRFKKGLDTQIDPRKNLLSGGQKQKVVLMREMLFNKPVVYLDEATSAIDQGATTRILQEIVKTKQTVLMIAHNLNSNQKQLFDREIHLEEK
ncbi:ATP-binding cassette domain-containing protein [Lactobacillus hominis]|uniref:ABC superfamily ATP binding cassette transporter ATP binding and permease protein n=1 Tax=Lactobacillus hominis DSM 23910 = CRBIP 24.179 TaxID=1423758 RepID=I7JUM6_9LACO|nr:ABC transporter ATP-binding protein [Lactobacillus hominis]KRM85929.1 ABC superfamily ATP binding cassette transporter ATP binding and permease protein [Lactobacillus hominis DSM 23910 = CRBIP 24.179]MCT3348838.1 ABC transporter ATP-binding protein [Lactobacillus hominis]CCI81516.1 ABC superfamily ATP binding cassette transporter ATP binding and permease protein [Lactobacillus hominis DSM 23910 = CRBIP 24.179]